MESSKILVPEFHQLGLLQTFRLAFVLHEDMINSQVPSDGLLWDSDSLT